MSHFYASIQGNRGEGTRMGTARSGIIGHIRGWDSGVEVSGHHDPDTETDSFNIHATSGSNGGNSQLLGTVKLVDGKPVFVPAK